MCQNLFPNPLLNPALTQQHLQLQQKHFSKNPTELGMMQESIKPALGLFAAKIWSEKSNSKRGTCSWLSTQKCLGELWKFSSKVCSCSTSLSFMKSLHKPIPALHNFVIFQPPIPYFPLFRHPEHCNHHPKQCLKLEIPLEMMEERRGREGGKEKKKKSQIKIQTSKGDLQLPEQQDRAVTSERGQWQ